MGVSIKDDNVTDALAPRPPSALSRALDPMDIWMTTEHLCREKLGDTQTETIIFMTDGLVGDLQCLFCFAMEALRYETQDPYSLCPDDMNQAQK